MYYWGLVLCKLCVYVCERAAAIALRSATTADCSPFRPSPSDRLSAVVVRPTTKCVFAFGLP